MAKKGEPSPASPVSAGSAAQALPSRLIVCLAFARSGASRRGVDMGPSAVRVAGLEARLEALGHQVADGGNIRVEIAETQASGSRNARYLNEITETCIRTAEAVLAALEEGRFPLLLGGDHSLAAGSVSEQRSFTGAGGKRSVCCGSMRTPTSTPRRPRPRAMCTACRWPRSWGLGRSRWQKSSAMRPRSTPKMRF